MAENPYQGTRFRKWAIDNVTWTPLDVSLNCTQVVVTNQGTDEVKLRSDDTNANSEITLASGNSITISSLQATLIPTVYAKSTSTTGPLILEEINP